MTKIRKNDFVVAMNQIGDIVERSVGIVKEISNEKIVVFFIQKKKLVITSINDVNFLDVTKTGKPYPFKICNICYILKKDFEDFGINQTDAKGRKTTRPSCRECRKQIDGDKFPISEKKRLAAIKPKYIFECPICNKTSIVDVTGKLVMDHDHKTGKAREWICDSCNTGIGRFKDDIKLLEKAIEYLKKYSQIN
jgi:transcription elongation factor Elf1